jgi:hypothetical protein
MKCFWLVSMLFCAGLVSMDKDDNLNKLCQKMSSLKLASSCWRTEQGQKQETEKISLAFKNESGIPLKIRGRFGGKDPVNDPPTGYICDSNKADAPQVFVLENGHGIRFSINSCDLPLRIRTWEIDFDPDNDMKNGVPVVSSPKNKQNTVACETFPLSETAYQVNHGNYVSIVYNSKTNLYEFTSKPLTDNISFEEGHAGNYCPSKKLFGN